MSKSNYNSKAEIKRFVDLLRAGEQAWQAAGDHLVANLAIDPAFKDKVLDRHPSISRNTINQLERLGRGQVLVELLCALDKPGVRYVKDYDVDIQKDMLHATFQVLLEDGGVAERILFDLSAAEASLLFAKTGPRTLEEQRPILESKRADKKRKKWLIQNRTVLIPRRCSLDAAELFDLVTEFGWSVEVPKKARK